MAISESEFDAAVAQSAQLREGGYVVAAAYDPGQKRLVLELSTGVTVMVPVHALEGLTDARADDLAQIEIAPTGLGLHWPRLDADVYVPGLMQGLLGSKRWMAAQLGAAGGRTSTEAKAAAARENGRKGGRPRKQA